MYEIEKYLKVDDVKDICGFENKQQTRYFIRKHLDKLVTMKFGVERRVEKKSLMSLLVNMSEFGSSISHDEGKLVVNE